MPQEIEDFLPRNSRSEFLLVLFPDQPDGILAESGRGDLAIDFTDKAVLVLAALLDEVASLVGICHQTWP